VLVLSLGTPAGSWCHASESGPFSATVCSHEGSGGPSVAVDHRIRTATSNRAFCLACEFSERPKRRTPGITFRLTPRKRRAAADCARAENAPELLSAFVAIGREPEEIRKVRRLCARWSRTLQAPGTIVIWSEIRLCECLRLEFGMAVLAFAIYIGRSSLVLGGQQPQLRGTEKQKPLPLSEVGVLLLAAEINGGSRPSPHSFKLQHRVP